MARRAASTSRLPIASRPTSTTPGMPQGKSARQTSASSGRAVTAWLKGVWSIARSSAWRSARLSKGGIAWLKRTTPSTPSGSLRNSRTRRFWPRRCASSGSTTASWSTSPAWRAAAAVEGSGMICHSSRSKWTCLPPEVHSGAS